MGNSRGVKENDSSLDRILDDDDDDEFTEGDSFSEMSYTTGDTTGTYDTPYGSKKGTIMDFSDKIFVFTACCVGDLQQIREKDQIQRRGSATSDTSSRYEPYGGSTTRAAEKEEEDEEEDIRKITSETLSQQSLAPIDEEQESKEPTGPKKKVTVLKTKRMQRRGLYKDTSRPIMVIKKDGTRQPAEEYDPEAALLAEDHEEDKNKEATDELKLSYHGVEEGNENELRGSDAEGRRRVVYARHRVKRMCVDIETGEKVKGQLKRCPPRDRRPRKSLKDSSKAAVAAGVAAVGAGAAYMATQRTRQAALRTQQKEKKARKKELKEMEKEASTDETADDMYSTDCEIVDTGDNHGEDADAETETKPVERSRWKRSEQKESIQNGDEEDFFNSSGNKSDEQKPRKKTNVKENVKRVARGAALAGGALAGGVVVASQTRTNRKKKQPQAWEEAVKKARKTERQRRRKSVRSRSSGSKKGVNNGGSQKETSGMAAAVPSLTSDVAETGPSLADASDDSDDEAQEAQDSAGKGKRRGLLGAGISGAGLVAGAGMRKKKKGGKSMQKGKSRFATKNAYGGTLYDEESDDCEEAYHLPFDDEIEVEFDGDSNIVFMPLRDTYNAPIP
jgi:hypothetical protein